MNLDFYVPLEKVKTSISENQFKTVGKKVLKGLRDGFKGGNSDGIAALSQLMVSSNTDSYAENYDNNDFYESDNSSLTVNASSDGIVLGIKDFNKFCKALDLECDSSLEKDYKDYIYAGRHKACSNAKRKYF